MSSIDLKEIERRAFRSTFQDGVWDIFLGLVMLTFALGPLMTRLGGSEAVRTVSHLVYSALVVAGFVAAKRYVTMPRLGWVKFGTLRKRKLANARVILALSVVLGLLVFLLFASGNDVAITLVIGLFSANILIVFGLMAYFMDYSRLYGYAMLWALSLPVGIVLEQHTQLGDAGYVFFVTATPAVVIGVRLLVRFLREYPTREEGAVNGTV